MPSHTFGNSAMKLSFLSGRRAHEYFTRRSSEWNIREFLTECNQEPLATKLGQYIHSLKAIANTETGKRRKRAMQLRNRYLKASISFRLHWLLVNKRSRILLISWDLLYQGNRYDRREAKLWERERKLAGAGRPSVHLHNPTFNETSLIGNSTISGGITGQNCISKKSPKHEYNSDTDHQTDGDDSPTVKGRKPQLARRSKVTDVSQDSLSYNNSGDSEDEISNLPGFQALFAVVQDVDKFVLNTGTVVENVLFDYGKRLTCEQAVHSFIINVDDEDIESLFTKEEWIQISNDRLGLPPLTNEFAKILTQYKQGSLSDLRRVLMESYLPAGDAYNVLHHYDQEWCKPMGESKKASCTIAPGSLVYS
ncbi:hypothetical protein BC938DRAFT_473702 [Jimgerdemannia flammicorona]|uniref:Uncharacterized protein n=1 Tax=Jimgerdemannia flammicorona TaxID=994334 RepID=A0A433Q3H1_9FUNG|nr:hypothetical protein BC938DRAFT_473702 [Jimgerdemannia flammicorona]